MTIVTQAAARPPLDAEVAAQFDGLPPDSRWRRRSGLQLAPLDERRTAIAADWLTDAELRAGGQIEMTELSIPGPAGAPDLATLVLRPAARTGPTPGIYFLHGSGMVMPGNRTMLSAQELGWVTSLGATLVSVDYRVAPENPHPAPADDAYAGLTWTAEHAVQLGIDPRRLVLVGASAGGGLAAATALRSRDLDGPPVSHLILISPMLDDREATVSSLFEGVVWDRASNRAGWTALLGDRRGGPGVSKYAAPAREADLRGLPPTYLDCGSCEVFRDEVIDFGARAAQAGVTVELHVWAGAMHFSEHIAPEAEVSKAAVAARSSYLRRALGSRPAAAE